MSAISPAAPRGGTAGRAAVLLPQLLRRGHVQPGDPCAVAAAGGGRLGGGAGLPGPEPGRSLETGRALHDSTLVACTCSFELDFLNLVTLLEAGGVPALRAERGPEAPLLDRRRAGGDGHPAPLAPLFRPAVYRRAGTGLPELAAALALPALAGSRAGIGRGGPRRLPTGPAAGGADSRQILRDVDAFPRPPSAVTPHAELSDMFPGGGRARLPAELPLLSEPRDIPPLPPALGGRAAGAIRPALAVTRAWGSSARRSRTIRNCWRFARHWWPRARRSALPRCGRTKLEPRLLELLAASGARRDPGAGGRIGDAAGEPGQAHYAGADPVAAEAPRRRDCTR